MPDSLLKALKLFVVVGGIVIVGGTATLIFVLVKRGTSVAPAPVATVAALPGTIELPPGGAVAQMTVAGSRLLLLGRAPDLGQFVLEVDLATGARRQLLRLAPAAP
jgi:hypothetical protein